MSSFDYRVSSSTTTSAKTTSCSATTSACANSGRGVTGVVLSFVVKHIAANTPTTTTNNNQYQIVNFFLSVLQSYCGVVIFTVSGLFCVFFFFTHCLSFWFNCLVLAESPDCFLNKGWGTPFPANLLVNVVQQTFCFFAFVDKCISYAHFVCFHFTGHLNLFLLDRL